MRNYILIFTVGLLGSPALAEDFPTLSDKSTSSYLVENFGDALGAAETDGVRKLHPNALELIMAFEGWFPDLYNDPAGYCTIGYGHLIALRKCMSSDRTNFPSALSLSQGSELLEKDTAGARLDVQRLVTKTDLNEVQFGALTSFVFNVGANNFKNSTMLRRLNDTSIDKATRIELAANEFPRWIRAGGVIMNGLIARRSCEAALFAGVKTVGADGKFNRNTCDSLGAVPVSGEIVDILKGE